MKPHKLDTTVPVELREKVSSVSLQSTSWPHADLKPRSPASVNNVESWTTSYGSCERLKAARQGPDAARGAQEDSVDHE